MMIARDDEVKRSRIWRFAIIISSVLIVVIVVYLLMKMFTANPLEGSWEGEDGDIAIHVGVNGTMTVSISDVSEGTDLDIKMSYTLDKDAKTITIREDASELDRLAGLSDGAYTRETLESALANVMTTFNYNIESGVLTLSEREYGEQLTFTKK